MITLSNSFISMGIVPDIGASVSFLRYKDQDILKPAPTNISHANESSLFVMLPYCYHIVDEKFTYFGIERHVPKNDPKYPYPIHGDGWLNAWHIENSSENHITLSYQHHKNDRGFPFDYDAQITYRLQDNQLNITIALKNPGRLPMPCGIGLHPCFQNKKSAKLFFKTTHVWYHQNDPIFDRPYETPKEWDFKDGKSINEKFDTAFGGWDGQARIQYPNGIDIKISAPDLFRHLALSTSSEDDNCFCLQPISNTPDAFNLAALGVIDTGIQSIGPGQTLQQTISLEITQNV